jgi:threonine dehydrogenase-like Zn-dependent dehydrogenase
MLAVHFLGNGKVSLDEVQKPEPQGREVVVRVKSASICGTDRENLEGPGQETIPGHENAGEVVAVDKPAWVEVGDRVAINCHVTCGGCEHCLKGDLYFCKDLRVIGFDRDGGYAEYVLVPEACCMPIPNDISFEVGSLLVDMLGTPFRAVKRARLLPGDRVGVWGAGPIGLGALMVARAFAAQVAILDPNGYRLDMARTLGADLALNPGRDDVQGMLMDWTDGRGLDVAFDCVGSEVVAHQALDTVKKRGTLVVVGVSCELTLNPWEQLICNELTIFGTRNFNTAEFSEMIALVRRGLPVEQVVTHRFPLVEAEAAFELFRSAECGKVLLVS